jgi:hypothetical protein
VEVIGTVLTSLKHEFDELGEFLRMTPRVHDMSYGDEPGRTFLFATAARDATRSFPSVGEKK